MQYETKQPYQGRLASWEYPIPYRTQAIPKKTLLSPVPTPQVFPPSPTPLMPLIPSRSPPPKAVVRIKEGIVGYSDKSDTDDSDDTTGCIDITDIKPLHVNLLPANVAGLWDRFYDANIETNLCFYWMN